MTVLPLNIPRIPSHFSEGLPHNFQNIIDLLQFRGQSQPHQIAYTFLEDGKTETETITYAQLNVAVKTLATRLQTLIQPGDRVLLLYPPGLDFIVSFLGCLSAGAIAVPLFPPKRNQKLSRLQVILSDAEAKIALTNTTVFSHLQNQITQIPELETLYWIATDEPETFTPEVWQPPQIDDKTIAFLQYTSGSTGQPKGVMVSHQNLLHNSRLIYQGFGHTPDSHGVIWLPFYHDMGLIGGVLQPLYGGFPVSLMSPMSFLQNPLQWLQAISHYQASTSGGPNFAYDLCVQKISPQERKKLDLSHWKVAFTGAEPVRAETLEQFADTFAECGFRREAFYPCYGMAEATLFITGGKPEHPPMVATLDEEALQHHRVIPASPESEKKMRVVGCGHPGLDTQIRIVDPDTAIPCKNDQVGEIWVSGESVTQGYWNQPELTQLIFNAYLADTHTGPFLRTGDLGFLHDGELFVTGRCKDVMIIRGCNYYPQDLEMTVENAHSSLRAGSTAAFTIEQAGESQLVIVAEVERRYMSRRRNDEKNSADLLDCRCHDRRYKRVLSEEIPAHPQPYIAQEVMEAIQRAVSESHGLCVRAIALLRPGSLPKTSSGKIQRFACRQGFLDHTLAVVDEWSLLSSSSTPREKILVKECLQPSPHQAFSTEQITQWLIDWLATELDTQPHQIDSQQSFFQYGLDSVNAARLIYGLSQWLGFSVDIALAWEYPTITALAQYLAKQSEDSLQTFPKSADKIEDTTESTAASGLPKTDQLLTQLNNLDHLSDQEVELLLNQFLTTEENQA